MVRGTVVEKLLLFFQKIVYTTGKCYYSVSET